MVPSWTCGCWSITASVSSVTASSNSTLLWHLHDLWPELQLPGGALFSKKWSTRIGGRLARTEQTMRVRIARDMLRRLRELTDGIDQLERDITALVEQIAPQLVAEPGFGPLIVAKLVGEIAGAERFPTPAKLARVAGVAPIPASSGNTQRHRLDRGGNSARHAVLRCARRPRRWCAIACGCPPQARSSSGPPCLPLTATDGWRTRLA